MAYQGLGYELSAAMAQARATGLFSSLASFSSPVSTQGPTGNPIGTFSPVAGYQSIPCMDAPESILRISAAEMKAEQQIEAERFRHVLLSACYPALREAAGLGWRVTVTDPKGNATLYDLTGAESDSQATQTRLKLQRVTL